MIHYELCLGMIQETWYYKVIGTSLEVLEKILLSSIDTPFNPIYIFLYINHCHIGFFGRFPQIRIVKGIYFHSHIVFFVVYMYVFYFVSWCTCVIWIA